MKGLRKYLTPFAPDQSGAVSVLYEMGAMTVVIDAGGCTGNICGFDEPRWHTARSAVFSAGLRDIDAILGRDDLLLRKIETAAKDADGSPFGFIALIGTPVPAVIGTDTAALARIAERKTGLPAISVAANGMQLYDKGAEAAWLELFRKFAGPAGPEGRRRIGVIGYSPLDFSLKSRAELATALSGALGQTPGGWREDDFAIYGLGRGTEEISSAASAERNLVLSPAGIAAAEYLKEKFGTPYTLLDPFAGELLRPEMKTGKKKILIVHQSVTSLTLRDAILRENPLAEVTRATWFMAPPETGESVCLKEEDDFEALVSERHFDVIVADEVMRDLARGFDGLWVDACHFAVSGRRPE